MSTSDIHGVKCIAVGPIYKHLISALIKSCLWDISALMLYNCT